MKRTILMMLVSLCIATLQAKSDKTFTVSSGRAVLVTDPSEAAVVKTAAGLLERDWQAVFGTKLQSGGNGARILAGTAGQSNVLRSCGVNLKSLKGRRQAFLMEVNDKGELVIAGSDRHGTAYGLMELSRLIGVSPWEWWADATPAHRSSFSLNASFRTQQEPSVEYRGIFINDEDWGLMPWSYKTNDPAKRGIIGPKTTERIFELLLRLRANTYWPPMHECSYPFFMTPGNREVAERFGIYMGASHCEPMASSAAAEWALRGKGDYDYVNNSQNVLRFWQDRVKEVARQDVLYTIGMRGVHDGAMQGAKTVEEQKDVLTRVFKDQRSLLAQYVNKDVTKVPQVFIPYKEVLDVYNAGLTVPEDVTLMWCDDNYGYIRHMPTAKERARRGGNGVYYHVSYWGRPHDYLWLGTFSPVLLYQQMTRAYENGINRIWILNVGDIKPIEYQVELFMDMAWNIDKVKQEGVKQHLDNYLTREFGDAGHNLTNTMWEYYRLNYISKPEYLGNTRTEERDPKYNVVSDMPWSEEFINERLEAFEKLEKAVCIASKSIPEARRSEFFQLVEYPVSACSLMNKKMLTAQLARHGKADFEDADRAFNGIVELTNKYNEGTDGMGKWRFMMDYRPRELSVFEPVIRKRTRQPLPKEVKPLFKWNATDCSEGKVKAVEGLGYEGKAAEIPAGQALKFNFGNVGKDSVEVEVAVVPTHPMTDNSTMRLEVSIDGGTPVVLSFETKGRSEEWKQNVLRNQAIKNATFRLPAGAAHRLQIKALDRGIILDQILIK